MIDNVKTLDDSQVEKTYERFRYIVGQYKGQPHLLNSYLSNILDRIVSVVKTESVPPHIKHRAFQYMQLITNVRGYKIVVQHLPHDSSDLEPVLTMLEAQDQFDTSTWETRYCLLLWLSIIVKIPFHMSKFDGSDGSDPTFTPIMQRYLYYFNGNNFLF
ncbi:hypothetical protein AAG570_010654 [Ranatra chinensis]|uniref:Tubulin-specific chaperone D C-terminal domain-containing protein n=1 Tax=Ranatra chinensis TaxID=642074 RepID=A0ABD0YZ51_9HEMI